MKVLVRASIGVVCAASVLYGMSHFSRYEDHQIVDAAKDGICQQNRLSDPQKNSSGCTEVYQKLAGYKPVITRTNDNTAHVDFYFSGVIKTQATVVRDQYGDWNQQ